MNNSRPVIWPLLEEELKDYFKYFKGNVLNAGAGNRDLSRFINGKLYNLDLPGGQHNKNIHIFASSEKIPVKDGAFDSIICNAVLEHVANPNQVLSEFYRVLKREGYLYLSVPFMQAEHKDPNDYIRFTKDGLTKIVEEHGFSVIKVEGVHSVYHTIGWIIHEWLSSKRCISYWLLRQIIYPFLRFKTKYSKTYVDSIASAYRLLGHKK